MKVVAVVAVCILVLAHNADLPASTPSHAAFDSFKSALVYGCDVNVTQQSGDDKPIEVPSPGVIILGSLGAALVAWFRRRRWL